MTQDSTRPSTVQRLRRAGLRATGPRLAILVALEGDGSHPTPEAILESLRPIHPSLSLSTVYTTLEAFARAGLCRRVRGDGARLRVDGTAQDHDHALCRSCGSIFDVERGLVPLPETPITLPSGLRVTGLRLEYDVICADCQARDKERAHGRAAVPAAGG